MEIHFNWKEAILSFKANGKDCGNALKTTMKLSPDEQAEYRLVISILLAKDVKLMVEGYSS